MYIKIVIKSTIKIVHKVHNLRVLGWCWRRLQKFIPQTDFRLASRCKFDPSLQRLRWIMIKMDWTEYLLTCACNGCCGSCLGRRWASAAGEAPRRRRCWRRQPGRPRGWRWGLILVHLFEGTGQVLIVLVPHVDVLLLVADVDKVEVAGRWRRRRWGGSGGLGTVHRLVRSHARNQQRARKSVGFLLTWMSTVLQTRRHTS